jgi:hypothetical protein
LVYTFCEKANPQITRETVHFYKSTNKRIKNRVRKGLVCSYFSVFGRATGLLCRQTQFSPTLARKETNKGKQPAYPNSIMNPKMTEIEKDIED